VVNKRGSIGLVPLNYVRHENDEAAVISETHGSAKVVEAEPTATSLDSFNDESKEEDLLA